MSLAMVAAETVIGIKNHHGTVRADAPLSVILKKNSRFEQLSATADIDITFSPIN
jgi:hypothetical protein